MKSGAIKPSDSLEMDDGMVKMSNSHSKKPEIEELLLDRNSSHDNSDNYDDEQRSANTSI